MDELKAWANTQITRRVVLGTLGGAVIAGVAGTAHGKPPTKKPSFFGYGFKTGGF